MRLRLNSRIMSWEISSLKRKRCPSGLRAGAALSRFLLIFSLGITAFCTSFVQAQTTPVPGPVKLSGTTTGAVTASAPTSGPADGYEVLTYTGNGTFTPPPGLSAADVLVIGGGGGGGSGVDIGAGGGGGAGRMIEQSVTLNASQATITVGAGGSGGAAGNQGGTGGDSIFSQLTTITATGGGGGGSANASAGLAGGSGGAGGSGASGNDGGTGAADSGGAGFGNAGGDGRGAGNGQQGRRAGGGGGGGGSTGQSSPSNGVGGDGGSARTSTLFGGSYAGGGGGGANSPGSGGGGGAGDGIITVGSPSALANTGSGGGGARNASGGSGGSGRVAIRYYAPTMTITQQPPSSAYSEETLSTAPQVRIMSGGPSPAPLGGIAVTVSLQDSVGTPTLGGTLTVNTDASGYATFSDLSITGDPGDYSFRFTTAGAASNVVISEQISILVANYFTIEHADAYGLCTDYVEVTVTLRDSFGDPVTDYTGTVEISNSGSHGSYIVVDGINSVTNAGSGVATYTFDEADDGVVVLGYSTVTTDTITFDANDAVNSFVTENYALTLEIGDCTLAIQHSGLGGSCSPTSVTFSILDPAGGPALGYTGTITVDTVQGSGNWVNTLGGAGVFDNGSSGDGQATYEFVAGDNATVTLGYQADAAGTYSFTVSSNDSLSTSANSGNLTISADCQFRISHSGSSSVCTVEEVTIRITDASGNTLTGYTGLVNISTAGVTGGNWSKTGIVTDAEGTLSAGTPNTGAASYEFVPADNGEITLRFSDTTAETVNFNIVAAGVSQPSGVNDPDLVIGNCTFRVTHDGSGDVCSIEQVTITLVDADGNTATDYTGTVNLTTSTGYGTWNDIGASQGALTDPFAQDGSATYSFDASDNGQISLGLLHSSATGLVNVNVTDGISSDPQNSANAYDQNISLANCVFEISHAQASNACEETLVTFTLRNSQGNVAVDYEGTMRISNNINAGDWNLSGSSQGVLTAPSGSNTGVADYQFDSADNGEVILRFHSQTTGTINFDVEDGPIEESGTADPNLAFSGCYPAVVSGPVCTDPGSSASINVPAQSSIPELRSRMVMMATMQVGSSSTSTSATFNGEAMTLVKRERNTNGTGVTTELWALLDADLPATSGSYTGVFSNGVGNPAICLIAVNGLEQTIPVESSPDPTTGPVNGTQVNLPNNVPGIHPAETRVTTAANNSFIVSAVTNDNTNTDANSYFFRAVQPSIDMNDLWGGPQPAIQNDPPYRANDLEANPSNGMSAGSAGVQPSLGLVEITEHFNQRFSGPTINAHVVAAFKPLVAGAPQAEGYHPVELYRTFAGRISYRAVGRSLRTQPSPENLTVNAAQDCAISPTPTTADLLMPAGANVSAAYLYWGGSGTEAQADSEVSFGPSGSTAAVVAEDVFVVEGVTDVSADFFIAYAEVTNAVTGNDTYEVGNLTVQTGAPWNTNGTCAGGWSLIVVYEHPDEHLRVANLFHGFQPFQYSAFTLVPRNFRMATFDPALLLPNGQVTHFTLEGDEQLFTGDESLGLQTAPDSTTFVQLSNSYNPEGEEFNSTVTRPIYTLGSTGYFEHDAGAGVNGDGYENDFPVAPADEDTNGNRIGSNWGMDLDTHYLSHLLLEDFGDAGNEAERFTTRYSSGQDMVMLASEVVSIANYPVADIEVHLSSSGNFKVGGTGSFYITVTNNGNNSNTGGEATGEIIVTQRLPDGMTLASTSDVSGTGWSCSLVTLDPGAFTCIYDLSSLPGSQLDNGDSLPLITANVLVGEPPDDFPLQSNTTNTAARVLHSGGSCTMPVAGVSPDPATCIRVPQFDNVNDLQDGAIDLNDLTEKSPSNNNVDGITVNVAGRFTDLSLSKSVATILESGSTAQYQLTVTNLGPDATTTPITLNDLDPSGVDFTAASGVDWSCSSITPTLTCTYSGSLALNASTSLVLDVDVTGSVGDFVTNTAQVAAGNYNFDLVSTNNTSSDTTQIVGPPVSSQERFLLSVSTPGDATTIGGLGPFQNDDYVIYDPATDLAEMYFDNSALSYGVDDANAVHLLKNGHIVMSAAGNSTVGSNSLAFGAADLVRFDPITLQAYMLLDGDDVFADPGNVNITSSYVMDDCPGDEGHETCSILLSTESGGTAGSNSLTFTSSDIIRIYRSGPNAGQAEIYLEGSDAEVFGTTEGNGNVDVDAFYVRVDENDASAVVATYALSVDNATATIGDGLDPVTGTLFTRDDVTELDLEAGANTTQNLFLGDQALGIFEPSSTDRRLDALHLIEDGYIGHFGISQVQTGSVCEAGILRISKHEGLSHGLDTDYYGSIRLSTSTGQGIWQLESGNGVLTNIGGANDGQARYTFVASDQGTVDLRLAHGSAASVSVNVSNGVATELGTEDPNFIYNEVLTPITFADLFTTSAFNNNDGSLNFENTWQEVDGVSGAGTGVGVSTGNIQVVSGSLQMTSSVTAAANNIEPSLSRVVDLDDMNLPYTEDVWLRMHYGHTALSASDSLVVEARGSSSDGWVELEDFTGITTNNASSAIFAEFNLSTAFANNSQSFSSSTEIRFRVNNGYEFERFFYIRDVSVETATNQCGYTSTGQIDHYRISHPGTGISCVGVPVTISAHDSAHTLFTPNESITLGTSTNKGTWSRVLVGSGTLTGIGTQGDNGIATYTFPSGEDTVTLLLNHTVSAEAPSPININVSGAVSGAVEQEDPSLSVVDAGLAFYNETTGNYLFRNQIAGKPSSTAPLGDTIALQAVRSSDNDPFQCSPLFDAGETLTVELGAECLDPQSCAAGSTFSVNGSNVALTNDNTASGAAAYTDVALNFVTQSSGFPGATIVTNYSDVGQMQLHARYNIPFGFFGDTNPINSSPIVADDPGASIESGDYLLGSSNAFVVRPFGLAVDFESTTDDPSPVVVADRDSGENQSVAADEDGSVYRKAGENFAVLVSAVAWQAGDDCNLDGHPDDGTELDALNQPCSEANLFDNAVTPNFYNDSEGLVNDYRIKLTVASNQAEDDGGVLGVLDEDMLVRSDFSGYGVAGVGRMETYYDEVGIIDIEATLIDNAENAQSYLSTEQIRGRASNVGRFYPDRFEVLEATLSPRVEASCTPPSSFTYMGEPFGLTLELVARNVQGQTTENYRAGFAKLSAYDDLNIKAIEEVVSADNNDLTDRLSNDTLPTTYEATWSSVTAGHLALEGNVIFNRATPAEPDGPFDDLIIAFVPIDSDSVTLASADLDTEITQGDDEFYEIDRHDYYYGRLLVDNAYGPETEALPITFRVEYFDGERFIINTNDDCTTISADELDLLSGTYTGDLASGETSIVTPQSPEFNNGQITGTESALNPVDAPMTATAPGEGNSGTVDVELDLDALSLPFLQFKWPYLDNDYDENPRARLEFGVFRSHDRVINWQEVYNGATP